MCQKKKGGNVGPERKTEQSVKKKKKKKNRARVVGKVD